MKNVKSITNKASTSSMLKDKEDHSSSLIFNINSEKDFEKFLLQSTNHNIIDNDLESTKNAIVTMVRPLFSKIRQKEDDITDVMSKAKGFSEYYQKGNETLTEDAARIKEKRSKLKLVCEELAAMKQRLIKREAALTMLEEENRANEELLKENEAIHRTNEERFTRYIEQKAEELTRTANEINRLRGENEETDRELTQREQEMTAQEEKMLSIEKELIERNKKLIDLNDQIIYQSTANTEGNQPTSLNTQGNKEKNEDNPKSGKHVTTNTNNNINIKPIETKYAHQCNLNRQIEAKRAELDSLNRKCTLLSNELHTKEADLSNRWEIVTNRERELNLQKEELYKKLHEVEKRLEETKLLAIDLKQKEAYINTFKLNEKYLMKPI